MVQEQALMREAIDHFHHQFTQRQVSHSIALLMFLDSVYVPTYVKSFKTIGQDCAELKVLPEKARILTQ